MKTDTLFYKIFQTFPQLVFQLLDQDVVPGYTFISVEVKEKSFRFDGVFIPPINTVNEPIYFIEVQFQQNPSFYLQFLSEIFLYLNQQQSKQNWKAVAIFPSNKQDVKELSSIDQELINSGRVVRVYLDEITDLPAINRSPELGMIKLITCTESEATDVVREIRSGLTDESIVKFIGDILFYKFPKLSRKEIEIMFALEDLRQTKVFQEAKDEGRQEGIQLGKQEGKQEGIQLGKQEGKQEGIQLGKQEGIQLGKQEEAASLLLRLMRRKFGSIALELLTTIGNLNLEQLESLGEALLDFTTIDDLYTWLDRFRQT